MVRKKIENRIPVLIENSVATFHRSFFVICGAKARDQVVILHHMLSKAAGIANSNILWCYKKELGFSTHRKKRMRLLHKKRENRTLSLHEDDTFDLFISSNNIRYCYYSETHTILGQTYEMLILQDFEALTPNLLARTVETVKGGGMIVILLQSLTSLKQLYTMAMDVHARYRTEAHQNVVGRFNERFILSLPSCDNCLVIDDKLNILPISSNASNIKPLPPKSMDDPKSPKEQELDELKESLQDTQPVGVLIKNCKTLDQAKAVLKFIDSLSEKTLRSTITLTSARGRGKSAALGFAVAGAIAFSYSNIFVTSPSPENLKTLFVFVMKGFDALGYEEHLDYEVIQSANPEFNKAIVRVNVFREHRQTIQYVLPSDADKLGQAELVVIDEAAAIPLPFIKSLLGPYLVFMASTINGYEGTGRSLSLKLINQLRQQSATFGSDAPKNLASLSTTSTTGRTLHEITLDESIRYGGGDSVEAWLNRFLCLDATVVPRLSSGCPLPSECDLYYINRDTLFSYHKASEAFLQRIVSLFVASHYKNSPNDLLMMSDAPAHHLFCLLPPVESNTRTLPEVLCVIQVCLEGKLTRDSVLQELSRGKRAAGDLIPWTVSQQFQDKDFASLSGARIVRIATHSDYQKMGYGKRALQLLQDYYECKIPTLSEVPQYVSSEIEKEEESTECTLLEERLQPRKTLPPLLLKLSEKKPERLDYIGVSYGLTADLLRFWKRAGYVPVYLRQTANDLTGENSCIMLKALNSGYVESTVWLKQFWQDFRKRYVSLLSYQFRNFLPSLALSMLLNNIEESADSNNLTNKEIDLHLSAYDIKRLEMYCQNLVDYHIIMDLMPTVAKFYFLRRLGDVNLSYVQSGIILCLGLQHKTVDQIAKELELPSAQILGQFNRAMRKLVRHLRGVMEAAIEKTIAVQHDVEMAPTEKSLDQELNELAEDYKEQQSSRAKKIHDMDLAEEYAIKGSDDVWEKALQGGSKTHVSIKSLRSTETPDETISYKRKDRDSSKKFKKKNKKPRK